MFDAIVNALKKVVFWLIGFGEGYNAEWLNFLWNQVPTVVQVQLEPYLPMLGTLNYWVPVDDGFLLLVAFLEFAVVFIALKLVLKILLGFFVS